MPIFERRHRNRGGVNKLGGGGRRWRIDAKTRLAAYNNIIKKWRRAHQAGGKAAGRNKNKRWRNWRHHPRRYSARSALTANICAIDNMAWRAAHHQAGAALA